MRACLLLACFLVAEGLLRAQSCPAPNPSGPTAPSVSQTLRGKLVYHDDIRQWFELKLDSPQCGQASIEEVGIGSNDAGNQGWRALEHLRGCEVNATGVLDFSPTGYYSLDIYQAAEQLKPIGECTLKPAFTDYSHFKPATGLTHYRVEMDVNYGPGDHPVRFHVTTGRRLLKPWQAYTSYMLSGGFVLYGYCAEGFTVKRVFGNPQAHPSDFGDGSASFDPETAAAKGVRNLKLGYTCVRAK